MFSWWFNKNFPDIVSFAICKTNTIIHFFPKLKDLLGKLDEKDIEIRDIRAQIHKNEEKIYDQEKSSGKFQYLFVFFYQLQNMQFETYFPNLQLFYLRSKDVNDYKLQLAAAI